MKKIFSLIILSCALPFFLMATPPNSPEFMKGYIYSKLEDNFPNANILFDLKANDIIIYSWPENLNCEEIKIFLESCCDDCTIQFTPTKDYVPTTELDKEISVLKVTYEEDGFLPALNSFFPTMLAKPHILGYSLGYRSYDKIFKGTIPISIGDQFSLYQFKINTNARLYLGIEACVWAFFEARVQSLSLINADYYISIPLTYYHNNFSARLRIFHQSSHLGDEFIIEHPHIERKNPSMEGLDLTLGFEPIDRFVLFLGYSRILRSDDSFKVKPNNVYYGFNYHLNFAKIQAFCVEGIPYVATYFTNNENNNWGLDSSVAIGYQWKKKYGHKLRIYVMGHDGYSAEGQFAKRRAKYV
ncbi:MAG: DUF1207 domain-containing protein, partial [Parachlamydiaceae bacterium]|nr:DUF1207 domain-containing protein [Parachlamydiaceae bacterium]